MPSAHLHPDHAACIATMRAEEMAAKHTALTAFHSAAAAADCRNDPSALAPALIVSIPDDDDADRAGVHAVGNDGPDDCSDAGDDGRGGGGRGGGGRGGNGRVGRLVRSPRAALLDDLQMRYELELTDARLLHSRLRIAQVHAQRAGSATNDPATPANLVAVRSPPQPTHSPFASSMKFVDGPDEAKSPSAAVRAAAARSAAQLAAAGAVASESTAMHARIASAKSAGAYMDGPRGPSRSPNSRLRPDVAARRSPASQESRWTGHSHSPNRGLATVSPVAHAEKRALPMRLHPGRAVRPDAPPPRAHPRAHPRAEQDVDGAWNGATAEAELAASQIARRVDSQLGELLKLADRRTGTAGTLVIRA